MEDGAGGFVTPIDGAAEPEVERDDDAEEGAYGADEGVGNDEEHAEDVGGMLLVGWIADGGEGDLTAVDEGAGAGGGEEAHDEGGEEDEEGEE